LGFAAIGALEHRRLALAQGLAPLGVVMSLYLNVNSFCKNGLPVAGDLSTRKRNIEQPGVVDVTEKLVLI
jgi:hypothetical protein